MTDPKPARTDADLRRTLAEFSVPSEPGNIGLLNLGPRLSQQEYSADDRKLLSDLATQTAPAVRVAQLVRQQQQEAKERERIEQELKVARLIQQTLLPKALPDLPGYDVAAYYQPAREVGGDFYDFFELEDGRLGLVVGDVTDKGVPSRDSDGDDPHPAARRRPAPRLARRGPREGQRSAGGRHPGQHVRHLPLRHPRARQRAPASTPTPATTCRTAGGPGAQRARRSSGPRGMPLGLLPGMGYEEKEIVLEKGETILFYSDGLVEAHDPDREMFSFPRLQGLVGAHRSGGSSMIGFLLSELRRFTGEGWEQEDDITLVTLERSEGP